MKINAEKILKKRTEMCWSQEELALAAGLNLRTIQRIESEASASLQSKKALASALDIDIQDLEYEEMQTMKKYEYKVIEIDIKEGFFKPKLPDLAKLFNREGEQGWRLAQIIYPEAGNLNMFKMNALMEREILN